MNSTNRASTTEPTSFDPTRRAALVAGILYLVTFLASIPAVFLQAPVIEDPGYVAGQGATMQVGLGAVLDMVNALAAIGTAVALFSVLKRQHEGIALGFVTTRLMEAAIISIGVVSLLAIGTLQTEGFATADAGAAVVAGRTLVAVRDWTFLLGPCLMPALNGLLFGTLLYRARLVPRAIPVIGLVGAPVMIAFVIATMLGLSELGSTFNGIAGAPFFVWELAIALWMTLKGFDRKAPIVAAAIAEDEQSARPSGVASSQPVIASTAGAA
jgi:hypothetical protein